jgi:hypothetical protein
VEVAAARHLAARQDQDVFGHVAESIGAMRKVAGKVAGLECVSHKSAPLPTALPERVRRPVRDVTKRAPSQ